MRNRFILDVGLGSGCSHPHPPVAGQFGAMPHLKFKIFTQFSVVFKKDFWNF
jgi:hypothetical protein